MDHPLFEFDAAVTGLPLWGQVLLAARAVRRAALLPASEAKRGLLLGVCDALERCAEAGSAAEASGDGRGERGAGGACRALRGRFMDPDADALEVAAAYAIDAALAAEASLDFGAAEAACTGSVRRTLQHVSERPGLSPLRVRLLAAADMDQIRFACGEVGVGKYDGLGRHVFGRLAPVYAPEAEAVRDADATGGTR